MRAVLCLMLEDISVAKAQIVRLSGDLTLLKTCLSRASISFSPLSLPRIPTGQLAFYIVSVNSVRCICGLLNERSNVSGWSYYCSWPCLAYAQVSVYQSRVDKSI